MRLTWKLLSIGTLLAVGLLLLLPGGPGGPRPAYAYDCTAGNTGTLRVDIIDDDTTDEIVVAGAVVQFNPDTQDAIGVDNVTDNGAAGEDNSAIVGRIVQNNTCSTEAAEVYTATLISLPTALTDCAVVDANDSGAVPEDVTTIFEIHVDCEGVAMPTPTAGPAASVVVEASFPNLLCSSFNLIIVTVEEADGAPKQGAAVELTATLGTLERSLLTTNSNGQATTFYQAPAAAGGTVTITARVVGTTLSDTTTFIVNCGAAPTPTKPPTTTAQPATGLGGPSTGDGGLADGGDAWPLYAGLLAFAVLLGSVAARRLRA